MKRFVWLVGMIFVALGPAESALGGLPVTGCCQTGAICSYTTGYGVGAYGCPTALDYEHHGWCSWEPGPAGQWMAPGTCQADGFSNPLDWSNYVACIAPVNGEYYLLDCVPTPAISPAGYAVLAALMAGAGAVVVARQRFRRGTGA